MKQKLKQKHQKLRQQFKQEVRKWIKSEYIHCDKTVVTIDDIFDAQSFILSRSVLKCDLK